MTRRTRSTRRLLGLALGLLLLGATSADAGGTTAIVLEKNSAAKTLTLDDGRTLKVTSSTRIETEQGDRVPFDEVPAAHRERGRYAITGSERIEYEATEAGGSWIADRIVLKPVTAQ